MEDSTPTQVVERGIHLEEEGPPPKFVGCPEAHIGAPANQMRGWIPSPEELIVSALK